MALNSHVVYEAQAKDPFTLNPLSPGQIYCLIVVGEDIYYLS